MTTYSIYSGVASATTGAGRTAPVLVSAVVENAAPTKVVLTYDQALDETSVPETTDFTLAGKTISLIEVSGTDVTVTVSAAYAYGDSIAISYTAGTNPIRGSVGEISADDLIDESVTNNVSMDTDLATYIDGLVTPLSAAQLVKINTFLLSLKSGLGITALSEVFDVLYYLGNETAESSLRNMVKRSHDATAVNSPTHTPYEGWTGDGISSYIDSSYNANTDGDNYISGNAAMGVYMRSTTAANKYIIGTLESGKYNILSTRRADNSATCLITAAGTTITTATGSNGTGMFIGTRGGATDQRLYMNKAEFTNITNTPFAISNLNFVLLGYRTSAVAVSYMQGQMSLAFTSKNLIQANADIIYDTFQTLMTANGKQV